MPELQTSHCRSAPGQSKHRPRQRSSRSSIEVEIGSASLDPRDNGTASALGALAKLEDAHANSTPHLGDRNRPLIGAHWTPLDARHPPPRDSNRMTARPVDTPGPRRGRHQSSLPHERSRCHPFPKSTQRATQATSRRGASFSRASRAPDRKAFSQWASHRCRRKTRAICTQEQQPRVPYNSIRAFSGFSAI